MHRLGKIVEHIIMLLCIVIMLFNFVIGSYWYDGYDIFMIINISIACIAVCRYVVLYIRDRRNADN